MEPWWGVYPCYAGKQISWVIVPIQSLRRYRSIVLKDTVSMGSARMSDEHEFCQLEHLHQGYGTSFKLGDE